MEQRRKKWGTFDNINQWFQALKEFLIEKGFAEERPQEEWARYGELKFFDDQDGRIGNLDESPLTLDDTEIIDDGRLEERHHFVVGA